MRARPGDLVITPAVDRLSRDTTDLLGIAATCSAPGQASDYWPEPFLDTTSDFAEIIFAILGVAAKLELRRILERSALQGRRQDQRRQIRPQADPHPAPAERSPQAPRSRGDTRTVARTYNVSQCTISRL